MVVRPSFLFPFLKTERPLLIGVGIFSVFLVIVNEQTRLVAFIGGGLILYSIFHFITLEGLPTPNTKRLSKLSDPRNQLKSAHTLLPHEPAKSNLRY